MNSTILTLHTIVLLSKQRCNEQFFDYILTMRNMTKIEMVTFFKSNCCPEAVLQRSVLQKHAPDSTRFAEDSPLQPSG